MHHRKQLSCFPFVTNPRCQKILYRTRFIFVKSEFENSKEVAKFGEKRLIFFYFRVLPDFVTVQSLRKRSYYISTHHSYEFYDSDVETEDTPVVIQYFYSPADIISGDFRFEKINLCR